MGKKARLDIYYRRPRRSPNKNLLEDIAMTQKRFIGLDVHKNSITAVFLSQDGTLLARRRFSTSSLPQFAASLSQSDSVALEATSGAYAVASVIKRHTPNVHLCHPAVTRLVATNRFKSDKIDAKILADLLRTNYLPEVWMPDEKTQLLRRRLSHRASLVKMRTQTKNRIHSILRRNLINHRFSDLFGRAGLAFLKDLQLPEDERWQLDRELELLETLNQQIEATDREIAKLVWSDERVRLLMTIPGIDYVTASAVVAAIGDAKRFASGKKVASYFGLCPSLYESGERSYKGRITKHGRGMVRWLLVQAAWIAVRRAGPLRAFYRRVSARRGKQVAIVGVARKLAVLCWRMLMSGEACRWMREVSVEEKEARLRIKATGRRLRRGERRVLRGERDERRRRDERVALMLEKRYEAFISQKT